MADCPHDELVQVLIVGWMRGEDGYHHPEDPNDEYESWECAECGEEIEPNLKP